MTIQFQCHGCGNPFAVAEQMAGSMAQCNRCGTVVTVPQPAAPPPQAGYAAPSYPVQSGYQQPYGQPGYGQPGYGQPMQNVSMPSGYPGMNAPIPGAGPFGMGPPPAKPADNSPIGLIVGGGVAAAVLALGVVLLVFISSSGSKPVPPPEVAQAPPVVPATPATPPTPQPSTSPNTPSPTPTSSTTLPAANTSPSPFTSAGSEPAATSSSSSAPSTTTQAPPASASNSSEPISPPVATASPVTKGIDGRPNIPLRVRLNVMSDKLPSKLLEAEIEDSSWEEPFSSFAKKDDTTLAPWSAKPDPVLSPLDYKKGKITTAFPKDYTYELHLPPGPSNFVFPRAKSFRESGYVAFDLRTGKPVGKPVLTNGREWYRAFSPDGRYMIAQDLLGPVNVYSFATGEQVHEIDKGGRGNGGSVEKYIFAGPHKLLTLVKTAAWSHVLHVWDLKTRDITLEVQLPNDPFGDRIQVDSLCVSPGGRYVTFMLGKKLSVVDLETGQAAGQINFGDTFWHFHGACFDSTGEHLAIVGQLWSAGERVFVIDFAQGVVQTSARRNLTFHSWNEGPALQYTPDDGMLLFKSEVLFDAVTGRPVWRFQNPKQDTIKMLRASDLMFMQKDGAKPGLQTLNIPTAPINKALEQVQKGGSGADVNLPPLSEAKLAGGKRLELPEQIVKWAYQPIAGDVSSIEIKQNVQVAPVGGAIRGARLAGPKLGQVILHRETSGSAEGTINSKYQLERLDLASGQKTNGMSLPEAYTLADASPSGNLALISFTENDRKVTRLDVVALSPKKHVLGLRPYTEDAARAEASVKSGGENVGEARTMKLLSDERLLTVNPKGKLVVWDTATGKAVYYYEKFGRLLAFSPTRSHLVAVYKGHFRIFDALTGEAVGTLETPFNGTYVRGAAFRADGAELAAVLDAGLDKIVVRWDLRTGKVEHEFPISSDVLNGASVEQAAEKNLVYRGSDHLLIASEYLLNLPRRAVIWRYAGLAESFVPGNSDAKSWHCLRRGNDDDSAIYLTARDMPSSRVNANSENQKLEDQLVLFPGSSVRLDIDLSAVGLQAHHSGAAKAIEECLNQRGVEVGGSGLVMSVRAGEQSTGTQIGVSKSTSPFGGPSHRWSNQKPDQIVDQKMLVSNFTIRDVDNRSVWTQTISVPMRSWGTIKDGNASEILRKEMYDQFTSLLSAKRVSLGIPTFVFKSVTQLPAGESEFYTGGERDPKSRESKPAAGTPGPQPGQPFSANPFGGGAP